MVDLFFTVPDLEALSKLEWLVTNGIGGYASGTVSGVITRRYHGLLVASIKPPVDRVNMVVKLDEWARVAGKTYPLFANQWLSKAEAIVPPTGCSSLRRFFLDGHIPTWHYDLGGNLFEKKIWMVQGANTTYLRLAHLEGEDEIALTLKGLLAQTNFHHTNKRDENYQIEKVQNGVKVSQSKVDAQPYFICSKDAEFKIQSIWMNNFFLSKEDSRGLDAFTDLFNGVDLRYILNPGKTLTVILSTDAKVNLDGEDELIRRREYEEYLIDLYPLEPHAEWVDQLITAADQFIVQREVSGKMGHSVVAGYHWFGDWGRDTMISLPGLTLATGRFDVAESILRTFAMFLDKGMLPNRFPDLGEEPEYNTIDATFWYFEALYQYLKKMEKHYPEKGEDLIRDLFPKLVEIIEHHHAGTRYGIRVDKEDGLIYGGEDGVQLTWMDAKVGDFVVTPRIGKPVEINGLWYSALRIMSEFSKLIGEDDERFKTEADKVKRSFQRFWNSEKVCCFDVLDGPGGDDDSLRPNQVIAASVAFSPLNREQKRQILEICEAKLLTRYGLRSLAPDEEQYKPIYGGDIWQRDTGYHQGTVWGWLIGPYLLVDLEVNRDKDRVMRFLGQYSDVMAIHGVGSISEIFDGDPPHTPRGCVAQAWSVSAALWILDQIRELKNQTLLGTIEPTD